MRQNGFLMINAGQGTNRGKKDEWGGRNWEVMKAKKC